MERFLTAHYTACAAGDSNQQSPIQWDFMSSFFFTGTILTTIGEYHLYCTTTMFNEGDDYMTVWPQGFMKYTPFNVNNLTPPRLIPMI